MIFSIYTYSRVLYWKVFLKYSPLFILYVGLTKEMIWYLQTMKYLHKRLTHEYWFWNKRKQLGQDFQCVGIDSILAYMGFEMVPASKQVLYDQHYGSLSNVKCLKKGLDPCISTLV